MNKDKLTRAGFEPATSGLRPLPTELTSPILAVSLFCQYLCSGGTSQKSFNHILPFSQGSCPSYDTTWEEAVRGCTLRGYDFFTSISCNKPQGELTGYILDIFLMNKEQLTKAGFEPATCDLCFKSDNDNKQAFLTKYKI